MTRRVPPVIPFVLLEGRRYGDLVVVADGGRCPSLLGSSWCKRAVWCRCLACGKPRHLAYLDNLESGNTRTCGCGEARMRAAFATKHRARPVPAQAGVE